MDSSNHRFKVAPYIECAGDREPEQLNLFENQGDTVSQEACDAALSAIAEQVELLRPSAGSKAIDVINTFNIYPVRGAFRHLKKANVRASAEAGIASDWTKVFQDLCVAMLRQTQVVEREVER